MLPYLRLLGYVVLAAVFFTEMLVMAHILANPGPSALAHYL